MSLKLLVEGDTQHVAPAGWLSSSRGCQPRERIMHTYVGLAIKRPSVKENASPGEETIIVALLRRIEEIERALQMNDQTPKTDLGLMSFYRLLAMSCVNSSFGPKKI